ncbi:hypothetical protein AB6N24_18125 [Cellulomonas sp. 179-A 4D5 NHS]|uniref:hypothetical protein n=1 Tax=Cellulomonas sp. 179-A 4D5 NHS TaxID=3142378 RepID=UPI0039A09964
MSGPPLPARPTRYELRVLGDPGPAVAAWLGCTVRAPVPLTTVFSVRLAPGLGPDDLASMVAARGLVLLRARCVPAPPATGPAPR